MLQIWLSNSENKKNNSNLHYELNSKITVNAAVLPNNMGNFISDMLKTKVQMHSQISSFAINYLDRIIDIGHLCLFDLILYVPSTIFKLNRDGFSWVEPVLS